MKCYIHFHYGLHSVGYSTTKHFTCSKHYQRPFNSVNMFSEIFKSTNVCRFIPFTSIYRTSHICRACIYFSMPLNALFSSVEHFVITLIRLHGSFLDRSNSWRGDNEEPSLKVYILNLPFEGISLTRLISNVLKYTVIQINKNHHKMSHCNVLF